MKLIEFKPDDAYGTKYSKFINPAFVESVERAGQDKKTIIRMSSGESIDVDLPIEKVREMLENVKEDFPISGFQKSK